jgi:hypothetical protein
VWNLWRLLQIASLRRDPDASVAGAIAHILAGLRAVRYHSESQTIVQRMKPGSELAGLPKISTYQRPSNLQP